MRPMLRRPASVSCLMPSLAVRGASIVGRRTARLSPVSIPVVTVVASHSLRPVATRVSIALTPTVMSVGPRWWRRWLRRFRSDVARCKGLAMPLHTSHEGIQRVQVSLLSPDFARSLAMARSSLTRRGGCITLVTTHGANWPRIPAGALRGARDRSGGGARRFATPSCVSVPVPAVGTDRRRFSGSCHTALGRVKGAGCDPISSVIAVMLGMAARYSASDRSMVSRVGLKMSSLTGTVQIPLRIPV